MLKLAPSEALAQKLRDVSRREFMRLAPALAAALAAACKGKEPKKAASCFDDYPAPDEPVDGLPHLGGAPDTPMGRCIAAFCDTIVPGAHRDPEGAPGAIDVGGPALFFDPELPAESLLLLLYGYLEGRAQDIRTGTRFEDLTHAEREEAVTVALQELEPFSLAVQMVKISYLSSAGASCHLGYPGANSGYLGDRDLTFGRAMASEITEDGNLP